MKLPKLEPDDGPLKTPKVSEMAIEYKQSQWFKDLTSRVQKDYDRHLRLLSKSENGKMRLDEISRRMARKLHEAVAEQSNAHDADKFALVWRRVYNLAIDLDYIRENPFRDLKMVKQKPRDVVWTDEQVKKVVLYAVEKGYDRVAKLVCLCYDTAQRPGDIMELKRSNIRKDDSGYFVDFSQSKTGKLVRPALSPTTVKLLGITDSWLQWDLYLFTENEQSLTTAQKKYIEGQFREIRNELGYSEIQIRDLRRSAITQMGGVSDDLIMSASGHINRNQLNTYSIRTREKALEAQKSRNSSFLQEDE